MNDELFDQLYAVRAEDRLRNKFWKSGTEDAIAHGFRLIREDTWLQEKAEYEITSAGIVVLMRNPAGVPSVLLVSEKSEKGERWDFPSGSVDPSDKSPRDTALRELAEETGIVLPAKQNICYLTYAINPKKQTAAVQYMALAGTLDAEIESIDGDHYYFYPQAGLDPDVTRLALEPLPFLTWGTTPLLFRTQHKRSLLNKSHHHWAYRQTLYAIREKLALAREAGIES